MILTILADSHPNPELPNLKSTHGFSIHADFEGHPLLYDFGSEGTLLHNAEHLGIDLTRVENAILSHGHCDHAGDLQAFLKKNSKAKVFHGRGAFHQHWKISDRLARDISVSLPLSDSIVARLQAVYSMEDHNDFIILPAAPGFRTRPKGNSSLLIGTEGSRLPDDFAEELTVVFRQKAGLVVLTGCSHRGILNIVDQVHAYFPDSQIVGLLGGFHLLDSRETPESIQAIADGLNSVTPRATIAAGHCTEGKSIEIFSDVIGERFIPLCAGKSLEF